MNAQNNQQGDFPKVSSIKKAAVMGRIFWPTLTEPSSYGNDDTDNKPNYSCVLVVPRNLLAGNFSEEGLHELQEVVNMENFYNPRSYPQIEGKNKCFKEIDPRGPIFRALKESGEEMYDTEGVCRFRQISMKNTVNRLPTKDGSVLRPPLYYLGQDESGYVTQIPLDANNPQHTIESGDWVAIRTNFIIYTRNEKPVTLSARFVEVLLLKKDPLLVPSHAPVIEALGSSLLVPTDFGNGSVVAIAGVAEQGVNVITNTDDSNTPDTDQVVSSVFDAMGI